MVGYPDELVSPCKEKKISWILSAVKLYAAVTDVDMGVFGNLHFLYGNRVCADRSLHSMKYMLSDMFCGRWGFTKSGELV